MILSDEDLILWKHKHGTCRGKRDTVTYLDPDAHIVEHLWKLRYRGYVNTWRNMYQRYDKDWTDLPGSTVITIPAFKLVCVFYSTDKS